ncbi:hypothetical protein V497_04163, partial [Pseudogymnoascus sp. VKM F-4516 (FW-969)]
MGDNSASSSGSPSTAASDNTYNEQEINVLITGFG